uniref:Uncharacterized protein n=1 Tax=Cacopsylla melanoneura TaxID=428564 RepID=A0A8D8UZD2_9HEMI
MFGIRAKALFVYLAVSFVLTLSCTEGFKVMNLFQCFGTKSSGTGKFGCNFRGDKYAWNTNTPIWSTQNHTPADIYFENSTQSDSFIESIQKAFVETLIRNPLSNVDPFLRFIQAYKNQTENKRSLESFFNDYNVRFQPLQDPVSFLIQISHQLVAGYPRAGGQVYMVSAYVDPPERFVKYVKKSDDNLTESTSLEEELTKDQFQRHVAGVIKIKINNTRGIISIDLDEKLFIIKLIK